LQNSHRSLRRIGVVKGYIKENEGCGGYTKFLQVDGRGGVQDGSGIGKKTPLTQNGSHRGTKRNRKGSNIKKGAEWTGLAGFRQTEEVLFRKGDGNLP